MLDVKIGYEIGYDYYAYSLAIPNFYDDKIFKILLSGYLEAKKRLIKQRSHDVYVKKWLQLRVNAWKRNRFFSEELTPELIKKINNEYCPITKEKLTHSTREMSDWSVDRINNNAAYAKGNITIVSTRANVAKSNYSCKEIYLFAYDKNIKIPDKSDYSKDIEPLTRVEWARWALLCAFAIKGDDDEYIDKERKLKLTELTPYVTQKPSGLIVNESCSIQMLIALKVFNMDRGAFKKLLASISKDKRKAVNKIVKKASKLRVVDEIYEIWFSRELFLMYVDFFSSLTPLEVRNCWIAEQEEFSVLGDDIDVDSLKINTRGFVNEH